MAMQERKRKLANSVYNKGEKNIDQLIDADTISALLAAD